MGKKLILTEKPSVSRDFVKAGIDSFEKKDGYYEGNNYLITNAFGHLLTLYMPEDYNDMYKKWDINKLPFIPDTFRYKPIDADKGKHLKMINKLISRKDVDTIVIATDSGREGELIARLIINTSRTKKTVERFWTSKALSPDVIKNTLNNLKNAKEYDRLYQSAVARQYADYIVGINGTMAFTTLSNTLISIGRVQTATLAILARRELEIKNFVPEDYYNIFAEITNDRVKMQFIQKEGDEEESPRIDKKTEAEKILKEVENAGNMKILSVESKEKKTVPPKLFSLGDIQKEGNKLFGFSADTTLSVVQSLYEKHQCVSYPRSDSRHLDEDMKDEADKILSKISGVINFDKRKCDVKGAGKRVFDNSKLTDHHAIIPLKKPSTTLSSNEQKIFTLITKRFVAAFYPDYKYIATTIKGQAGSCIFKTSANKTIDLGWKEVYGTKAEDNSFNADISKGKQYKIEDVYVEEKQTTPPPYFNEGSILDVMEKASNYAKEMDKDLKKVLKDNEGIGTPATRSSIIETLKKREYVILKGKALRVTDKGMAVYDTVKDEAIADIAFTAQWEQQLNDIARGDKNISNKEFVNGITEYTKSFINNLKKKDISKVAKQAGGKASLGKCPECGSGQVMENSKAFGCNRYKEGCKFTIWKNQLSKLGKNTITTTQMKKMLNGEKVKSTFKNKSKGSMQMIKHEKYGWSVQVAWDNKK